MARRAGSFERRLPGRGRPAWIAAAAAAVCGGWVLYQSPGVEELLNAPDSGFSLAGGAQILSVGEQPVSDFFVDFGPLFYYASAAAQAVTGGRLIGEVALGSLALTAGYVLTFLLARALAGGWLAAGLLTATALLFVPARFYWAYPFVAGPAVVLAGAALYLRRGGRGPLALLALAVTLCGLFRHDYGVYAFAAAWTAVALDPRRQASLLKASVRLSALVLLFALPWLLAALLSGALGSYLETIVRGTLEKSAAFALPHPLLHWRQSQLSLLYAIFFLWPVAGLGLVAVRRRSAAGGGRSADLALAAATSVLGTMTLIAASHRADFGHLLYIVPSSLLCLAAVAGIARRIRPLGPLVAALLLGLGVAVPAVLGTVFYQLPRGRPLADVPRSLALLSLSPEAMLDRLIAGGQAPEAARLFRGLRRCTGEDQRILVLPYFPQAYYFSERPFAGRLLAMAPGYFSDPDSQRRQVEALRRRPPAVVLWHTGFVFDRDPERAPRRTHAAIFDHVAGSYERRGDIGAFSVFVPAAEAGEADVGRCLSESIAPPRRQGAEPRTFPPGDEAQFFAPAPTFKVKLAGETRNAVPARFGRPLERVLEVRGATRLEVAAGRLCGRQGCPERTFRVATAGPSGSEVLWQRTLGAAERGWVSAEIDLGRFAGRRLGLSFAVGEGGPGAANPAFWGEPLLLAPSPSPPPNVILISIDTLRADRLGCYGYRRDTSPALDAFARQGVLFRQAVSQAPWTTPSHMSLLTALYPSAHGVNQGWDETLAFLRGGGGYRVLPAAVDTLAEILRRHGYRTHAVTGGATLAGEIGFARGFDVYHEQRGTQTFDELGPEVAERLDGILASHREAPFFLFFHTFEVHAPYTRLRYAQPLLTAAEGTGLEQLFARQVPQPIHRMRQHLLERGLLRRDVTSALYDGGVRAVDDFLGRFFDELRRLGLEERTLIVVTSDHGEELGDHDPRRLFDEHGHSLYQELLHVPLMLRLPGRLAAAEVAPPVALIDVAPTILDLLDLPAPPAMQGRSLLPLIAGDPGAVALAARPVLSEATSDPPELKALRIGDRKLIAAFPSPGGERRGLGGAPLWERLFDLDRDPRELDSLHAAEPRDLERLRRRLAERFADMPVIAGEEATTEVSDEVRQRLRALGYLD